MEETKLRGHMFGNGVLACSARIIKSNSVP